MGTNVRQGIVTSGLILHVDAANRKSYISGSTAWNDMSGQGNNAILSGSATIQPTFDNANLGSIQCSGSSWVDFGAKFNYTSEPFSFSYWVYFNSNTTNNGTNNVNGPVIFYKGAFNTSGYYDEITSPGNLLSVAAGTYIFVTNQAGGSQITYSTQGIIAVGNWYNVAHTRSGTSVRIYVNGRDRTGVAASHTNPLTTTNPFRLSNYSNNTLYGNFKTANFMGYNRTLTATEVAQNYNALKTRFGLP